VYRVPRISNKLRQRRQENLRLRSHVYGLKRLARECSEETDEILQYHVRFAPLMAQRIGDASKAQYTVNTGPEATELAKDINEASRTFSEIVGRMTRELRSLVYTLENIQVKVEKKKEKKQRSKLLSNAISVILGGSTPPNITTQDGAPTDSDTASRQAGSEFRVAGALLEHIVL
jgi:hypothetical protein